MQQKSIRILLAIRKTPFPLFWIYVTLWHYEYQQKEWFLLSLYVSFMVMANTLGGKITTLFGVRVSVGIFFMPVMFLITDIEGEVCGKERAILFVRFAELMLVFLFLFMILCIKLPPNKTWGCSKRTRMCSDPLCG